MDLVVDANILFAALIKEGKTIEILADYQFIFYAPEYLFVEFLGYKEEILKKTHRTEKDFEEAFYFLKSIINIIPNEKTKEFSKEAEKLSPDEDDADYFAIALKLSCPIWSNDKELKKQNIVKIYSTEELLKL